MKFIQVCIDQLSFYIDILSAIYLEYIDLHWLYISFLIIR